jgi:hypothetical protein
MATVCGAGGSVYALAGLGLFGFAIRRRDFWGGDRSGRGYVVNVSIDSPS